MIDLRSDTVTRPTEGMRAAMSRAEVGDDVYAEDPTVRALEERVAGMLGHEAALLTPTGSMANVLAVRSLVGVGEEVLCSGSAHIARAELGAHGAIAGLTMRTWGPVPVDLPAMKSLFAPDLGPYFVQTRAISLENTHNFSGGQVIEADDLQAVRDFAAAQGVGVHIDGARLWNAHVATGTPLSELARADVVAVCLSKGLGAPIGSLVVGSAAMVAEARVWRKRLGGGMRQVGVLAAAGLYALDHHLARLADDHDHARLIADAIGAPVPHTNIVVHEPADVAGVVDAARDAGVLIGRVGATQIRIVTHLDVSRAQAEQAADVLARVMSG